MADRPPQDPADMTSQLSGPPSDLECPFNDVDPGLDQEQGQEGGEIAEMEPNIQNLGSSNRHLPPEVLDLIASHIRTLPDLICFKNTCRSFWKTLGRDNNILWYKFTAAATAAATSEYESGFPYYEVVMRRSGVDLAWAKVYREYCTCCLEHRSNLKAKDVDGMRVCTLCLRRNVIAVEKLACIPGLEISRLRVFTITPDTAPNATLHSWNECYFGGNKLFPRYYCWRPRAERVFASSYTHPSSLDAAISSTESARSAASNKCTHFFREYQRSNERLIYAVTASHIKDLLKEYVEAKMASLWMRNDGSRVETVKEMWKMVKAFVKERCQEVYMRHASKVRQFGREPEALKREKVAFWAIGIGYEVMFEIVGPS